MPKVLLLGLAAVILLTSCLSRKEVIAYVWESDRLPNDVCIKNPVLQTRGFYRKLNDDACKKSGQPPGCEEFISYCTPQSAKMQSMTSEDFNLVLDKLLPEEKQP
jgi:hypothetical protein